MTPLNNAPINAFADKVKMASRSKSRDIRLSIEEATELSAVLLQVLSMQNQLLKQISDMSKSLQSPEPISMSGGKI